MTRESMQFTLMAGYLMSIFDYYLTHSLKDGFFAVYGRKALGIVPETGDIDPALFDTFLPAVTVLAIERGIPGATVEQLKKEADTKARIVLNTPGALDYLRAMQIASDRAQRKARNN